MRRFSISAWSFLLCLITVVGIPGSWCQNPSNITGPISTFKSRPDVLAPYLNVTVHNDTLVTPGYIFIAPFATTQPGPYIYDNAGNLVWSGFGVTGAGPAFDFHVCSFNGSDHLCLYTGQTYAGYGKGMGLIIDKTFDVVESVRAQSGLGSSDLHEFNVVDGGKSALITAYTSTPADLAAYGITSGTGWILNSWFQEIEIGTNKVLFEWSALDHVDPTYSYVIVQQSIISGSGLNTTSPWDYFHINSVDKNDQGDYLISARHTNTIYKISAKTGEIMWQVGGKDSSFTMTGGLNFSMQHDARFIKENNSTTILSLFDNGSNGVEKSANYSSAMIIALYHDTHEAVMLQQFVAPDGLSSASQGNAQVLDNGNVVVGFGSNPYLAEYTEDGTLVLDGHFGMAGPMNYRAYKCNFTSAPTDTPTAYVYALTSSDPTTYYISWNGATEVSQWNIYTSTDLDTPFQLLNTIPKEGFETTYIAPDFHQWAIIEAVGADGNGIANSSRYIETFVPGQNLAASCNQQECPLPGGYSFFPDVQAVAHSGSPTVTNQIPTRTFTPTASPTKTGAATRSWSDSGPSWRRVTCLLLIAFAIMMT